ncbi:MAG: hypothetical protein ACYDC0_16300 [Acidimicrobiales bacterium]
MKALEQKYGGIPGWGWIVAGGAGLLIIAHLMSAHATAQASTVQSPALTTSGTNSNPNGSTTVDSAYGQVLLPPLRTIHPIPVSSWSSIADPVPMVPSARRL